MKTYTLPQMKDMYYEYINNYITISRMSDDYQTSVNTISTIINKIKLRYRITNRTITIYKSISRTSLQAIEYIPIKDIIQHDEAIQLIQNKYPDYVIERYN